MRLLVGIAAGVAAVIGFNLFFLVPLFLALGPEHALVAGTLQFNTIWIGIELVVCLTAAAIGGWVAHRVSDSIGAVFGVIAVVLGFGLLDAGYHQLLVHASPVTAGRLPWYQMLLGLREPLWYDIALPLLMAIFIWVTGSSREFEQHPDSGRGWILGGTGTVANRGSSRRRTR